MGTNTITASELDRIIADIESLFARYEQTGESADFGRALGALNYYRTVYPLRFG